MENESQSNNKEKITSPRSSVDISRELHLEIAVTILGFIDCTCFRSNNFNQLMVINWHVHETLFKVIEDMYLKKTSAYARVIIDLT